MALHKLAWRFAWDTPGITPRRWSTTAYVDAADAVTVANFGVSLWVNILRQAARERVYCYEVYASDLTPNTDNFAVVGVGEAGQRGTLGITGLGEAYKPEVCIAVTWPVVGSRPSRKFWRPGIFEGDITAGQTIAAGLVSAVESAFNSLLTTATELRDPDGQTFTGPVKTSLSLRRFGRESAFNVPNPPPFG